MAPIQLYYMPESSSCRMVEMAAAAVGIQLEKHKVNLFENEHLKDKYVKLNPLHKVPFIVSGQLRMNESRAISAYLINKYQSEDDSLYPNDPVKRAQVDEIVHLDASLAAAIQNLYRSVFTGTAYLPDADDEKPVRNYLAYFNQRLKSGRHKFILADHLTLADLALASTLSFQEATGFDMSGFKCLTSYVTNLKGSIINYDEINKEPVKKMKDFFKSKLPSN